MSTRMGERLDPNVAAAAVFAANYSGTHPFQYLLDPTEFPLEFDICILLDVAAAVGVGVAAVRHGFDTHPFQYSFPLPNRSMFLNLSMLNVFVC